MVSQDLDFGDIVDVVDISENMRILRMDPELPGAQKLNAKLEYIYKNVHYIMEDYFPDVTGEDLRIGISSNAIRVPNTDILELSIDIVKTTGTGVQYPVPEHFGDLRIYEIVYTFFYDMENDRVLSNTELITEVFGFTEERAVAEIRRVLNPERKVNPHGSLDGAPPLEEIPFYEHIHGLTLGSEYIEFFEKLYEEQGLEGIVLIQPVGVRWQGENRLEVLMAMNMDRRNPDSQPAMFHLII